MELITYLVANFNNGKYFDVLLSSLEQQTNKNWHCIICDDTSTDDSWQIIIDLVSQSPVKEKIQLMQNEKNIGYTKTLCKLIDLAKTDIVATLDADDWLDKEATKIVLDTFEHIENCGLVHTLAEVWDETRTHKIKTKGKPVAPGLTSLEGGFISHLKAFRVSLYRETDGIDQTMYCSQDRDLVYKLEEYTQAVFINQVLYYQRYIQTSLSNGPVKKKIGIRNRIRARKTALIRRQVTGLRYYYFYALYWLDYPHFLLTPFKPALWFFEAINHVFGIYALGELKRDGNWHH